MNVADAGDLELKQHTKQLRRWTNVNPTSIQRVVSGVTESCSLV